MTFRLHYAPPPDRPRAHASADLDDALYDLAAAGATARIELDGYELPLDGTGVVELAHGCRSLLAILAGGAADPADAELRTEIPDAPAEAVFHQWLFSSFMSRLPVVVFAVTPVTTWIATRTHEEAQGWPLVALEGRDLPAPVSVPTSDVRTQVRRYLSACETDARETLSPASG
jgi:hypothetical protein